MPANRGATPNWHPEDFSSFRYDVQAADPERYKPKSIEDLASFLGSIGMPEVECYFGEDKTAIARDIAERYFVAGTYADEMIDAFYQHQSPTSQNSGQTEVVTMLVAVKTHPDGHTEASASPAQYSALGA